MPSLAYGDPTNPWFSWGYVRDNATTIRDALFDHTLITVESVMIAVLIAVPLAVLAYWVRPLSGAILTSAGVLYTVPSLATVSDATWPVPVIVPPEFTVTAEWAIEPVTDSVPPLTKVAPL